MPSLYLNHTIELSAFTCEGHSSNDIPPSLVGKYWTPLLIHLLLVRAVPSEGIGELFLCHVAPAYFPGIMLTRSIRAIAAHHHEACTLRLYTRGLCASKFKVYTKTGDAGSSSLFNGQRRAKDEIIFAALGDTDELNAAIGVAAAHCATEQTTHPELAVLTPQFVSLQSRLLDLGSAIATPQSSSNDAQLQRAAFDVDGEEVRQLESWIDVMDEELPPLRNFILPSGGLVSASLHVARATCRRSRPSVTLSCAQAHIPSRSAPAARWSWPYLPTC